VPAPAAAAVEPPPARATETVAETPPATEAARTPRAAPDPDTERSGRPRARSERHPASEDDETPKRRAVQPDMGAEIIDPFQ